MRFGAFAALVLMFAPLVILVAVVRVGTNDPVIDVLLHAATLPLFAFLGAILLHRLLLKPLETLVEDMLRFGRGELDRRARLAMGHELERMTMAFNEMAARIEEVVSMMDSEMKKCQDKRRLTDEMLYTTSHELRAPLTTIKGYVQLALRQLEVEQGKEDVIAYLGVVNGEVDRMVTLINRLLDVARIETGHLVMEKASFDLVALISEAVHRMAMTAANHRLRVFVSEERIEVDGDSMRIEQVVVNLLANAIKYSPRGGDVDVKVSKVGSTALVSVVDYGIGIPAEKQSRVFERLYRVDSADMKGIAGTGLGLYISRAIVEAHGGEMYFESKEGEGSVFYFTIPAN